jgi:alcohol dehydrogenase
MLHRADCKAGDHVVITGASGGVGSATIQLAKRRGAHVTGITNIAKIDAVRSVGADRVVTHTNDLLATVGENAFDIAVDNVAGDSFPQMLKLLKRRGQYVSSGAIAGPIVSLDLRDLYLKDITMIGTTAWDEPVFQNLVSYIENGDIRPLLAKTFPLSDIVSAQEEFIKKSHVGNFVLLPTQTMHTHRVSHE